jgi:hypothetical protein
MDARAGSSNQHGSEDHLQMLPGRFRLISTINKTTVYKYSFYEEIMLRQSDINQAFRESILRSSNGFQYLHTRDFVNALRRRGIHLSEVEANSWIAREQTYFVDKTPDHSENGLWMMANMGRVL